MKTRELVLEKGAKDRQTALSLDCLLPDFVGNSLNTFCSSRNVYIHLLSSTGGSTWVQAQTSGSGGCVRRMLLPPLHLPKEKISHSNTP